VQVQIREGTTMDSARWLTLSGKWWFLPAVMASLSKSKRTTAVLLGDLPVVVKGGTGVARHGGAPRLER
jgi:hypothetical protein